MSKISKNNIVVTDKVYICDVYITSVESFDSTPLGSYRHSFKTFPSDYDILSVYKTECIHNDIQEANLYTEATVWACVKNVTALVCTHVSGKRFFITVNNIREINH